MVVGGGWGGVIDGGGVLYSQGQRGLPRGRRGRTGPFVRGKDRENPFVTLTK